MTSGRDALHQIDASIAAARRELAQASDLAAGDARAIASLDQRQLAAYLHFADIRLAHLRADRTNGGALGGVDREAEALIIAHRDAVARLGAARDDAAAELERLEAARAKAEAEHAAAVARHDAAAAETHARLETDPLYRSRADGMDALNAMAARVDQKLAVAAEDRAQKGAAYEADPLFQYLRKRKFATRDYRAFPLFALLDGWVASLIKYRDHRLNYDRLLEIPERFAEHAARLRKQSEETRAEIEALERKALETDGVGKLRDAAGEARKLVDALDAQIAATEAGHKDLAARCAAAAEGKEGPLADARALLAGALAKIEVPDLKVLAAETASPEDDRLVDALIRLRRERMELEEARRAAANSLQRRGRSLSELEDLRRRYKSARYDSPYSEFSGGDLIGVLLSEFLRGALGRDDVWRRIERGHRTRRRDWDNDLGGDIWRDSFGLPDNWGSSGPFGGGRSGGDWPRGPVVIRTPGGMRAPRPPRIPRSSSGRGGFRTGGGF